MKTSQWIIFIVVGTLATMALCYVGTIAYCILFGITPDKDLIGIFKDAGIFILGALTALLNNTRGTPTETPPATSGNANFEIGITGTAKTKEEEQPQ